MAKFRKKPVVIEAVQFNGGYSFDEMLTDFGKEFADVVTYSNRANDLQIHTLEGVMNAAPGDWVIRGVKGEFYPCKPDIFAATYDLAEQ